MEGTRTGRINGSPGNGGNTMKVLGIVGSPRKRGNTEILVQAALDAAAQSGAQTEMLSLGGRNIQFCDACYVCETKGECHIQDDLQEVYAKIREAEGVVVGSPVYFHGVTGPIKVMMDRFHGLYVNRALKNKAVGAILVAGGSGHSTAWNHLHSFFSLNRMFCADPVFGFARHRGDIRQDRYAMLAAGELGRQVVALVNQGMRFPEECVPLMRRSVKDKYGVDSAPGLNRFGVE